MHSHLFLSTFCSGFRASLKGNQPCLNLFFPGWTLDTRGKFAAAMIGIVLLGIFVEGVSKIRHSTVKAAKRANRSGEQKSWNPHFLRASISLLHGGQALAGYILMLATMTFSVELLFSAITGLALGYAVFFQTEEHHLSNFDSGHVTTNPCCNFMEEEARELRSEKDDNSTVVIQQTTLDCECDQAPGTMRTQEQGSSGSINSV
jgi:hypothetical protein